MNTYIKDRTAEIYPEMVAWRRYLHQHPELSYQEQATSRWIEEKLISFGLEVQVGVGGGYGITALLKGNGIGPTVALRADIDALPIQDEKGCDYSSTVPGVMHACGHDGHTAALLGAAKLLSEIKDKITGTIKFIFQPAEEVTPGGAKTMIEAGVLTDVDAIYGIHLWTPFPLGTASTKAGALMAAADEFELEIRGKGGHGGFPHVTIDSLLVSAHLVVNLQTIVSRSLNPVVPSVVTVGSLSAGQGYNVIADRATLKGTVRSFDETTRLLARKRVEEIIDHTCAMFGADYTLDYKMGYPPLINHPAETKIFAEAACEVIGAAGFNEPELIMAAEDFAHYLTVIPGSFLFVGAGGEGAEYAHHHPMFDLKEEAIGSATRILCTVALKRLGCRL
ncbi:MAG: amidohydrolase [Gorillibacterium sp.]|nr:amidohydrolase [Gorillibacterium sp.]